MKKICFVVIALIIVALGGNAAFARGFTEVGGKKLLFFYSPACHACIEVEKELLPVIEKQVKGVLKIERLDVSKLQNYKLLLSLKEKYRKDWEVSWPAFYLNGHFLVGKEAIRKHFSQFVVRAMAANESVVRLELIDLIAHFKSFTLLAVVGAGLVDGINPCAFTVIIFFISFLALQGYRKKELIIIGSFFILAVFITYFLVGLGIFNFFYSLKGFWLLSYLLNYCIGAFSLVLAALATRDFLKIEKTGTAEGQVLQLPQSVKNRIHYIIGLRYRKSQGPSELLKPHILRLAVSTFITGFLVSLLEAVCTGQLYLPTVSFVLKTSPLKLPALGYLVFYNLMFILPLIVIFFLALAGVSSEQFTQFLRKHLSFTKLIMAIVFFSLGIFLIWKG
jgi:hypothetical protein